MAQDGGFGVAPAALEAALQASAWLAGARRLGLHVGPLAHLAAYNGVCGGPPEWGLLALSGAGAQLAHAAATVTRLSGLRFLSGQQTVSEPESLAKHEAAARRALYEVQWQNDRPAGASKCGVRHAAWEVQRMGAGRWSTRSCEQDPALAAMRTLAVLQTAARDLTTVQASSCLA